MHHHLRRLSGTNDRAFIDGAKPFPYHCRLRDELMITLLTIFHVLICIFLILVVLLQQGKGADWAGTFGGGGSQTVFGARGAGTILSKATTAAAIIFMITSLALTILIARPGVNSVIDEKAVPKTTTPAPAPAPAPQPPTGQPAR
jgi:preprotein translocase subunit SecG